MEKNQPIQLTDQERKLEKSTAEVHGGFSLGLFATALLVNQASEGLWWITFVILGAVFVLSSIKLAVIHKWKRKEILSIASKLRIKNMVWFFGFVALGIGLIQHGWPIPGVACISIAYAILFWGIMLDIRRGMSAIRGKTNVDNTTKEITRPFPDKKPDVVYGLALDRLQGQQRQIDALDMKVVSLLGFGSALLAVMLAFLALREDTIAPIAITFLCVAGVAYLGIVASSLFGYYTRSWEVGPNLEEAWENARKHDENKLAWWAAESLTNACENNKNRVNRKVGAIRVNISLIILQVITLAIALLLVALN